MRMASAAVALALAVAACARGVPAGGQTPAEGDFPNGDITLHYRLDRPAGRGPFPAIVLGHGSGEITADRQAPLAANLVRRGFVVLRYDKRGVGRSGGEYSGVGVRNGDRMFALLAGDMAAGVAFLRAQSEVDGRRIGLVGVSQAGWIIPLAAARTAPAFMILISGPTVSVGEENYYSDFAEFGGAALDRAYEELARFTGERGFDPVPTLERLEVPGLWLLGQADESIPERNTAAILRGLAARGRPFTVVEYAGADHGLFIRPEGRMAPYWEDVDRWLAGLGQARPGGPG